MPPKPTNLFLEALPLRERNALLAQCKAVTLPQKTVLYEPEERSEFAYFLTSGIASSVTLTKDGASAEVGITGQEGIVNALLVLGPASMVTQGIIQVSATAYRIRLEQLCRSFVSSEPVRTRLLEFVQSEAIAGTKISGCHRLHDTEQRTARWLLMVQDRLATDELRLTQNFLAIMLGTGRPTVTLTMRKLQRLGCLEVHRGQVKILNRTALESAACECYRTVNALYQSLYKTHGNQHEGLEPRYESR